MQNDAQPITVPPIALADLQWQRFGGPLSKYQQYLGTRLWVPGGWLVSTASSDETEPVFVSDPDHTWDADYAAWKESQQ